MYKHFVLLFSAILLCLAGCRFPKDYLHSDRWWDYYERGLYYADEGLWKKAEPDFRTAIRMRKDDQRRKRTYGRHLIDYFPHCELGVVLYEQGRLKESADELETSLSTVKSAKAEYYLDRVRKVQIEKEKSDKHPPKISILSPRQPFLTNVFSVVIQGIVRDDNQFVRQITVGDKTVRMDVSAREMPFSVKIRIRPGENHIPVTAANLAGSLTETIVIVNADRTGPIISIDDLPDSIGLSGMNIPIKGYLFDASGLTGFEINGKKFPLGETLKETEFHKRISIQPGEKVLEVKAEDLAGNITHARIVLSDTGKNVGRPVLMAENNISSEIIMSGRGPSFVKLKLNNRATERTTYFEHALIDGSVHSDKPLVNVLINGEEIVSTRRNVYHFNHQIRLDKGENQINVMAISPMSGHSDAVSITINRKIPVAKMAESRLKIALSDLEFEHGRNRLPLSRGFEKRLASAMRIQEPRRFSYIDHLKTDKSEYGEAARKRAKKDGFDCILFGYISERETSSKKTTIRITARVEDTEGGHILIGDTDVYGEDADKDSVDTILDTLSKYMNMKLTDALPVAEGNILEKNDRNITMDIGKKEHVKKGMKVIVYELQESDTDADETELGEAIIRKVRERQSSAYLNNVKDHRAIKPEQHVITR